MSQLTFPIRQNELKLTVVIGLHHQAMTALAAAGQPLPAPVWTKGVIDTGSSISCVAAGVLQKIGLSPIVRTSTQTVRGSAPVRLFRVSLSIPPAGNLPGAMLTRGDLTVMELANPIPDVEVLIGLDILLDCRLLLDGPGRQFTLDF
jgi:hypothetical protein